MGRQADRLGRGGGESWPRTGVGGVGEGAGEAHEGAPQGGGGRSSLRFAVTARYTRSHAAACPRRAAGGGRAPMRHASVVNPKTRLARATVCTPPAWGFPQGVAGGARAPAFEGRLEDEQTRGRKARAAECNRKETHGTGGRWAWPSPPHPPSPGAKPDHERARARPAHPALPPGAAVAAERAGLPRRVHSLSCSRVCREERRVCLVDAPPRQVPPPRHPQLPHARHAAAAGDGRRETKRTPRFTLPLA